MMTLIKKIERLLLISLLNWPLTNTAVLCVSIPKAGTHLLSKLINQLGYTHKNIGRKETFHLFDNNLQDLDDKNFLQTHAVASKQNLKIAQKHQTKTIFIYRDPRDEVLSLAHFIKNKHHDLWKAADLNLKDLLSALIKDFGILYETKHPSSWNTTFVKQLGDIRLFYNLYLNWMSQKNVYTTSFEKLVGEKGGGSDEEQIQEIKNIINHIDIKLDENRIKQIADNLFGNTATFYKGLIGQWKKNFTVEHKALFKAVAGQMLIDLGYEQDFDW